MKKPLIIFCGTRHRTEEMARLCSAYFGQEKTRFYHAGLTKEEKNLYNLNDMMYNELYENGGLAFHLKFMYPQTITNRGL